MLAAADPPPSTANLPAAAPTPGAPTTATTAALVPAAPAPFPVRRRHFSAPYPGFHNFRYYPPHPRPQPPPRAHPYQLPPSGYSRATTAVAIAALPKLTTADLHRHHAPAAPGAADSPHSWIQALPDTSAEELHAARVLANLHPGRKHLAHRRASMTAVALARNTPSPVPSPPVSAPYAAAPVTGPISGLPAPRAYASAAPTRMAGPPPSQPPTAVPSLTLTRTYAPSPPPLASPVPPMTSPLPLLSPSGAYPIPLRSPTTPHSPASSSATDAPPSHVQTASALLDDVVRLARTVHIADDVAVLRGIMRMRNYVHALASPTAGESGADIPADAAAFLAEYAWLKKHLVVKVLRGDLPQSPISPPPSVSPAPVPGTTSALATVAEADEGVPPSGADFRAAQVTAALAAEPERVA
ncbi:hypothetical protein AMAG_13745 [Allomyces macrogynus ATCC 38327]|uniref:Uncharacterized protein n=1 Tax=Allomyces macrogynus (strain ATCC 38327) TaxID=578462 RepID=A0A0L0T483_ALLM3|nr:hypothetical protein AMAG_13745 [Allomyces macrogynus ATCC 38327]|eukprot:KNE69379.1 hypothetical protein AMAG_13745 [Allomyces macrogynus ATCC 38327]